MLTALGTGTVFSARIISTDVPLVFFWASRAAGLCASAAARDWRWAVVLGVAVGAGLLAKYAMIYFLPGMCWRPLSTRSRVRFWEAGLMVAFGMAVVTISPNFCGISSMDFLTLRWAGNDVSARPLSRASTRPLEFLASAVRRVRTGRVRRSRSPPWRASARRCCGPPIASCWPLRSAARGRYGDRRVGPRLCELGCCLLRPARRPGGRDHGAPELSVVALDQRGYRDECTQIVLIGTDAFATRILYSAPARSQSLLSDTRLGSFRAHRRGARPQAIDIPTIASDKRADVASLLYYWRDQPEQIWPGRPPNSRFSN